MHGASLRDWNSLSRHRKRHEQLIASAVGNCYRGRINKYRRVQDLDRSTEPAARRRPGGHPQLPHQALEPKTPRLGVPSSWVDKYCFVVVLLAQPRVPRCRFRRLPVTPLFCLHDWPRPPPGPPVGTLLVCGVRHGAQRKSLGCTSGGCFRLWQAGCLAYQVPKTHP